MKIIDFAPGVMFHSKRTQDSKFFKEVKKILNVLRLPWYDPCCEANDLLPVAYSTTAGAVQRFDATTATWITIADGGVVSTTPQNDIAAGTGGAIPVTNYLTTINTDAGGDAFTLANGTRVGQLKKILLVVDGGGNAVITPANLAAGTTITFNDATDYVVLTWGGTEWFVIENFGGTIA